MVAFVEAARHPFPLASDPAPVTHRRSRLTMQHAQQLIQCCHARQISNILICVDALADAVAEANGRKREDSVVDPDSEIDSYEIDPVERTVEFKSGK